MMHIDPHSTAVTTGELLTWSALNIFGSSASGKKKSRFDFGMNKPRETQQQQRRERSLSWFTR